MIDAIKLKTATEARNMIDNALKKNRPDICQAAFRRLAQIEGKDHDDAVVRQFWGAIAAVEEVLRQKHGRTVRAAYTRRKVAKVGEVSCLIDWAMKKHETEGFRMLVEAGLADQTGEYVVVHNPERFPPEVVAAANKRLSEPPLEVRMSVPVDPVAQEHRDGERGYGGERERVARHVGGPRHEAFARDDAATTVASRLDAASAPMRFDAPVTSHDDLPRAV